MSIQAQPRRGTPAETTFIGSTNTSEGIWIDDAGLEVR